jgi:hypothetical protein
MRRMTALKPSHGTTWPSAVREHVASHQDGCIGPLAGMPGACSGSVELDHVRASGGVGMKSKSIATNGARLCSWHHSLKTREGRTWRPRLLDVIARRAAECADCQRESIEVWGQELVA